ncbi:gliding motility-associated C-terminal domain-containing protein [Reichenbachiella agarivorans]|uniref:Gliding motility-associated C-terminal domain-containing protein n=1 Tax=Reichenbachiella agarivorans TaxID=2979464 RepID=A0ABY6CNI3_9BACT|nr:gliding motility-associated C-terminal domain-containing protein [Reichenbachiella agarivorans]UXP31028.1 gliding motility-associated C-terminal domain-containing protein [Reichenbachiella agarivorans]
MINLLRIKIFSVLALLLLVSQASWATHIRAGEIIAQRISTSTLTYRFSVIGYTDTGSTVIFGSGNIDFGDGVSVNLGENAESNQTILLEDEVAYNIFTIIHTFQGPGRYVIRYDEQNRNAGVVNMSNSVDTPFYIETEMLIDPLFGINNTPVFLVPPVDKGAVGATFLHNPGAYDPDGDSLSYHMTIPQQFIDRNVNDYKDPNDPGFYTNYLEGNQEGDGPPIFKIDSINGDLVWDAPGLMGEYNIAFIVKEWRILEGKAYSLGYVTRDMQIIIEETENNPPEIVQPMELCVEAGTLITETLVATDPDGDPVIFEAFGGPFEMTINPATYEPSPPVSQPVPANLQFTWQTDCAHVRERPYEIQLKAKDQPPIGAKLVDFKTWLIRVVAPAPTGLTATKLSGRRVELNWDKYTCGNADKIEIWRRVDSFDFTAEDCVVGMPANAGYELIDLVNNSTLAGEQITNYIDDNEGMGLAPGALYCYRIVAKFPDPAGGESYASDEACAQIDVVAPVVLNVDVVATDKVAGQIYVRWEEPFDLDPVLFPGPYTYDVVRFEGLSGQINGDTISLKQTALDITDTGLDTDSKPYHYLVYVYDNSGSYIDSSFPASSVWLDALSDVKTITLSWEALVPWSNVMDSLPYHRVYRDNVDEFFPDDLYLIDSAKVTESGFRYVDDGSHNGVELNDEIIYRYYVETKGSYGNPVFKPYDPLLNKSQILSAQPNDTIPPCGVVNFRFDDTFDCSVFLSTRGCDFNDYSNLLEWEENGDSQCDNDISSYNIYFSDEDIDGELPLLENVQGTQFLHDGLSSFKGCYQITSVDRSGNESERSERICHDNCPFIKMPNAFTPNGDGKNDFFTPFYNQIGGGTEGGGTGIPGFNNADCPRFVLEVTFTVFDRTGGTLFTYNSADQIENIGEEGNAILINWDGKSDNGTQLESGVYYYSLEVIYDLLNPKDQKKKYKGWVNILR